MFTLYGSDEEQLQALKTWWQCYHKLAIAAAIVIAIFTISYPLWTSYQHTQLRRQEQLFLSWQTNPSQPIPAHLNHAFDSMAHYIKGAYHLKKHQTQQALAQWQVCLSSHPTQPLKLLTSYRYARLLVTTKQTIPTSIMNTLKSSTFKPLAFEIQGDSYLANHQKKLARKAYQSALDAINPSNPSWSFIKQRITLKAYSQTS